MTNDTNIKEVWSTEPDDYDVKRQEIFARYLKIKWSKPISIEFDNRDKWLISRSLQNNLFDIQTRPNLWIKLMKDCFEINMRKISWAVVWVQIRYYSTNAKIKSKTKKWWKVWYFIDKEFDVNKATIITEWEVDFLTLLDVDHYYNIIWLQGVQNLSKLIKEIQTIWYKEDIKLLIDVDDAADKAIEKLINTSDIDIMNIFDCRKALWWHKDVNQAFCADPVVRLHSKTIFSAWISLASNSKLEFNIDDFVHESVWWWKSLNHNNIAKFIIWSKYIRASNENCFLRNGKIRKSINKSQLMKIIIDFLEDDLWIKNIKTKDKNAIYEFAIIIAEDSNLEKALLWKNRKEHLIYLSDWVYDVNIWAVRNYRLDDYAMSMISYPSTLIANCKEPTKSLKFLHQILWGQSNPEDLILFLQEWFWYLLVPSTRHEKSLLIYGDWANGKSVLCSMISNVLEDNTSHVWLHQLIKEQNLLLLVWKLLNLDEDMSHGTYLDSGIFKRLVSWESIVAKEVYRKPITIVPYTRFLLCTNHLPDIKHIDHSVSRRIIPLHLRICFKWKSNPRLKDELADESKEFFNWCVTWLKRLLDRWHFIVPDELQKDLECYIEESDPIQQFLESDFIMVDPDSTRKIKYSDLYTLYSKFCNKEWFKNPPWNRQLISRLVWMWFTRKRTGQWRFLNGLYDEWDPWYDAMTKRSWKLY